ncbi:hypothetical protein [Bacillus cereus group sp. RP43]|uniref:hypothetical protein n=1 Tax=Bacillus cereus group sp. RP43 TaxID=3040260 RepID=UPI0033922EBD
MKGVWWDEGNTIYYILTIRVSSCTNWIIDIIKVIREKRDVARMVEKEMEQLKAMRNNKTNSKH